MKQTLQLRLGQHLTMTPQLQQAIRLLQLSTTELQLEIQQALDSNLMLELVEGEGDAPAAKESLTLYDNPLPARGGEAEPAAGDVNEQHESGGGDAPVDSAWEDSFDHISPSSSHNTHEDRDYETQSNAAGESLREHLVWQMRLTPFSETDMTIATAIIDSVDDDGYLNSSLTDILASLDDKGVGDLAITPDEVEAVLHRIQSFDPIGVGARDLRECLLIQLQHYDPGTPWLAQARQLVEHHLDLLAARDYNQLKRQLKVNDTELREIIELIQSLHPRPGGQIADSRPQYLIPDVYVRKQRGKWLVELNPEAAPRLRINTHYASLVRRADNSNDNNYLKNHLQEARWFIKSLKSRNETLLKVATCIVERQRPFLERGEEFMEAMVLHDVAEAVSMHESTISRVTTQKFIHTPRGIFELKYFFSSHVNTTLGGECSATAIRALIKKLISTEETMKPLSDSKIANLLLKQGINVARRTIAKYRESLAIPPSNERKRLS
ncbi:MAG: RNA polymerase factor sigma-54 [Gammaproteobacteria bacterium]|nr:RNA polymerase factor sigma-54 [Gammaproteobacteria bacterium]